MPEEDGDMTLKEDCSTTMILNTVRVPIDLELRGECWTCGGGFYDGEYVIRKVAFTEDGMGFGPALCGRCMTGN